MRKDNDVMKKVIAILFPEEDKAKVKPLNLSDSVVSFFGTCRDTWRSSVRSSVRSAFSRPATWKGAHCCGYCPVPAS